MICRYYQMSQPAVEKQAMLQVSRKWFGMHRRELVKKVDHQVWQRVDHAKDPDSTDLPAAAAAAAAASIPSDFALPGGRVAQRSAAAAAPAPTASAGGGRARLEETVGPSLVTVDFHRPFSINGILASRYRGTAVVVDASIGLAVVDRNTVPSALGDVSLTFANADRVNGSVVFVHPLHNFAFVRYDPAEVTVPVTAATFAPGEAGGLKSGDRAWLLGLCSDRLDAASSTSIVCRQTRVDKIGWQKLPTPQPPRYQQANLELIRLQDAVKSDGGVIATDNGAVAGLWASFFYQRASGGRGGATESQFHSGVPAEVIAETAVPLAAWIKAGGDNGQSSDRLASYALGANLEPISMAMARQLGLAQAVQDGAGVPPQKSALVVSRVWAGTAANKDGGAGLEPGDVLLAVGDERPPATMRAVERAVSSAAAAGAPCVAVEVLRGRQRRALSILPTRLDGLCSAATEGDRLVFWMGLLVQPPPLALQTQRGLAPQGAYVSCRYPGSPAGSGPGPTCRILEVDGQPTPDLDGFLAAVRPRASPAGEELCATALTSCRVKYVELTGSIKMATIKLDPRYWATGELRMTQSGWRRVDFDLKPPVA